MVWLLTALAIHFCFLVESSVLADRVSCGYVPQANDEPLSKCNKIRKWDQKHSQQLAAKYAPIIYWHPMEQYHLQDPAVYFHAATLYTRFYRPVKDATKYDMLTGQMPDPMNRNNIRNSFLSVLTDPGASTEVLGGAPFKDGQSTAKIWYNSYFHEPTGSWVYNYNLFYSWNGCSQGLYSTRHRGKEETMDFQLCPSGDHEGDWERVSIMVCPDDEDEGQLGAIRSVILSAHEWDSRYDCHKGECEVEVDPATGVPHLVVFSALSTHANYPRAQPAWIYGQARTWKGDADGIYVVDRTGYGKKWVPSPQLLSPLPYGPDHSHTLPVNKDNVWSIYPGFWGTPSPTQPMSVLCYYDNYTRRGPCPHNTPYKIFSKMLSLNPFTGMYKNEDPATADHIGSLPFPDYSGSREEMYSGCLPGHVGLTGPISRWWTVNWTRPGQAPIWTICDDTLQTVVNHGLCAPNDVCPVAQTGEPSALPIHVHRHSPVFFLLVSLLGSAVFALLIIIGVMPPSEMTPAYSTVAPPVRTTSGFSNASRTSSGPMTPYGPFRYCMYPVSHSPHYTWPVLWLSAFIIGSCLVSLAIAKLHKLIRTVLGAQDNILYLLTGSLSSLLTVVLVGSVVPVVVIGYRRLLPCSCGIRSLLIRLCPSRVMDAYSWTCGRVMPASMTGLAVLNMCMAGILFLAAAFLNVLEVAARYYCTRGIYTDWGPTGFGTGMAGARRGIRTMYMASQCLEVNKVQTGLLTLGSWLLLVVQVISVMYLTRNSDQLSMYKRNEDMTVDELTIYEDTSTEDEVVGLVSPATRTLSMGMRQGMLAGDNALEMTSSLSHRHFGTPGVSRHGGT